MTTDDLLWRWLERPESLDAEALTHLHEALRTDPAQLTRARRHLQVDEIIARTIDPARHCFLAGVRERLLPIRRPQRPRRVALRWLPLAAAACVVVGLGLIWNVQRSGPPSGAKLADGSSVAVGADIAALDHAIELTLTDGSWLTLAPGSVLRLGSGNVAHQVLSGALTAEVTPRTSPSFIIRTADGSATVLGTRFRLSRQTPSDRQAVTELEVERGLVALANDSGTILVAAGRHGRVARGQAPELLPVLRRWTFESPVLPAELASGIAFNDPRQGACLRGTRYHESTNSLGLLAVAPRGLTRCSTSTELTFDYCITNTDSGPLYVWIQGSDDSQWLLPISPRSGPGWHQAIVPLARLTALDDPLRHPPTELLVTQLAISIGDGPGHDLLLDNVTLPEP